MRRSKDLEPSSSNRPTVGLARIVDAPEDGVGPRPQNLRRSWYNEAMEAQDEAEE